MRGARGYCCLCPPTSAQLKVCLVCSFPPQQQHLFAEPQEIRLRLPHGFPEKIHLYSWYGSKKLCFLQTPPVKMNRTKKKLKNKKHAKNSEDSLGVDHGCFMMLHHSVSAQCTGPVASFL